MWSETMSNHFEINVEEREAYRSKLEAVINENGKVVHLLPARRGRDIAFMSVNHILGIIELQCGTFWNEEDNLCPIVAMAHELGHYLDLKNNFNSIYSMYNGQLGVLGMEMRAWEYGFEVLKDILSDEHMKVAYEYAEKCLATYFHYPWPHELDDMWEFNGTPPTFQEAKNRLRKFVGLNPLVEEEKELSKFEKVVHYLNRNK